MEHKADIFPGIRHLSQEILGSLSTQPPSFPKKRVQYLSFTWGKSLTVTLAEEVPVIQL